MSKIAVSKPLVGDFTSTSSLIDSNSQALILFDLGDISFIGNSKGWFSYVYKRHTRIRILRKNALADDGDRATVRVLLYKPETGGEKIDRVSATTYNLVDNKIVETHLEKTDLFKDRRDKDLVEMKFTMPAAREGSIIDYTYTITSEYFYTLPRWQFQSQNDPCLWSEYKVEIPQTLSYIVLRQGYHKYDTDKGEVGRGSYRVTRKEEGGLAENTSDLTVSVNTIRHTWVMKNVPAFHAESFLTTPRNYLDEISFQLSATYNGEDTRAVTNNWSKLTEELLSRDDFGKAIQDDNLWLDPLADKITAGTNSPEERARAIYYYVKDHFSCTDYYDKFVQTNLQDVVKKGSGTVGDINLLLIALLRKKAIHADPVLLGTRELGFSPDNYPMNERMRYVIAQAKLSGGNTYYLDAAHRELGFGQLAGNCYNGHARVICEKDSGSVYFEADSLKENKTTLVLITVGDKGLEGAYQSVYGKQESYNARRRVAEVGEKAYFKELTSHFDEKTVRNTGIDSLNRPEDPLGVHFEFQLNEPDASILYINPVMGADAITENPFKALERKYPVEMPYVIDNMYNFTMQIPDGYVVDERPKSMRAALNGNQGQFEYLVGGDATQIQVRCHLVLKKAYFTPEDYNSLRDFFALAVKKEAETIVLKKK
jgi:transglutaminase-like putative cysteine protease